MADLLHIVDLADSSQVQLSFISGSGNETAPPADFTFPLTDSEMAEMRWYLSEYPENTFGEAKTRAETVESGLKDLGRLLYEAVFGSSDEARSLLEKATTTEGTKLSLVSNRPEFLGLPWELLNSGGDVYLVSELAGVSRRLSTEPLGDFSGQLPTGQLNVLLLLPPAGEGSGSIATEALAALESLPVSAELDCLRPSSEAKLQEQLASMPEHYHLVHFDGFTIDGQGICMEDGSGGVAYIDAATLAGPLTSAQTPVVLINASASSTLNDVMSFAAGLAQNGVAQVVVSPLPIAGAGRVLFCENFFKGLSGGMPIAWSDDYGARLGVMPRNGSNADVVWYEIDPCYVFHPVNAYEDGNKIVLDVCRFEKLSMSLADGAGSPPLLHRWVIDQQSGKVSEESLDDRPTDFPRVHDRVVGLKHRYGYVAGLGAGPETLGASLRKHDFDRGTSVTHDLGKGCQAGEPVFAASPGAAGEDEGWILSFVYDAARDTSDLVIIDASNFDAPPVARIHMPTRVPFGFHGSWLADGA